VFTSFFQCGFGLLVCNLFRGLLDHYKIELVHLNPNSILQIAIFVDICEAFLRISPSFPLFRNYFILKYQSSATNRKVIGGLGLQICPRVGFLELPLKISLMDGIGHGSIVRIMNPASLLSLADSLSSTERRVKNQPLLSSP
jgi:hypothetical protein